MPAPTLALPELWYSLVRHRLLREPIVADYASVERFFVFAPGEISICLRSVRT
jgi:hypothetical protein